MNNRLWPSIARLACLAGLALLLPSTLTAQCIPGLCTGDITTGQCGINDAVCTGSPNTSTGACAGNGCGFVHNCRTPTVSGPSIEILPQPDGTFKARLKMDVRAPWNDWARTNNPNGTLDMFWYERPTTPELCDTGFNVAICEYLGSDHTECWVERSNLTCAGAPYNLGTFSFRAQTCGGPGVCGFPFPPTCGRWVDRSGLDFTVTKEMLGCPTPPKDDCDDCKACKIAGPGRGNAGGGGGRGAPGKSGPGALLRYAAGGAGHPGFPGSAAWTPTLGRYWSHDYAERIIQDPNDSHVWLITKGATFREFSGLAAGVYQTVSPSDEYRKLHRTASGWELHELDGTVHHFDAAGLWAQSVDRNGNAKVAAYSGGRLASVTFPDGRSETFTYHASGKLATITEVGVGGAANRTWSYTWTGDDLVRIDRPDGTAWEFFYAGAAHPGYMTRMELVGTDASRRVETAWEYDVRGNVVKIWRGDASFTGANAVEKWSFGFDNATRPTVTTVTDPLGDVATYTIGRDTASDKPRITAIAGDCPSCGLGPNAQLTYEDANHPLRPTRTTDGRGTTTLYTYDADGMPTSKTEAAGTPLERTTTWEYHSAFPALLTRIETPSTSGTGVKATVYTYDANGNLTGETITGIEGGSAFSHSTARTFNTAGRATTIDPPGYGTQDVTSFTYDPARGDLLPQTVTAPLVGTSTFAYDSFNRRTSLTDPNGVVTETAYDSLDRVTSTAEKGATAADDLVTTRVYGPLGDLVRTILPRGNVEEYGYDAAGRLVTIERKPDAATPGERIVYVLNGAGNRTREELQRWNGSSWATDSATDYVYSTRCHLDKAIQATGAVTEYAYDCEDNLERVWDANHPSAGQTNPATQVHTYDVLNRLTSVAQLWGGAGGGTATTSYGYDVQDNLVQVIDPNGTVTSSVYSDRGLLTQEVSETSGVTSYAYNEHGFEISRTDATNITVIQTVDALDRVVLTDYPESSLDTIFTYDDPAVPFSKGRLTAITRNGAAVAYSYDRFGRRLQDGALSFSYDKNGNRVSVGYPGSVTATYGYDFADRQATLSFQEGSGPAQVLVSASSHKALGPLATLTLGNGLSESRAYDGRYLPSGITVPGRLDWTYATDAAGNVTAIDDNLSPGGSRSFSYQPFQSFLTQADGPWGTRAWTYDKAGNRLTETRDGVTDSYSYAPNAAGGSSPRLAQIAFGAGGTAELFHDASGELRFRAEGEDKLRYSYGADRHLSQLQGDAGTPAGISRFLYDGRRLLARSTFFSSAASVTPEREVEATYNSRGLLFHRSTLQRRGPASPRNQPEVKTDAFIFYFAARPVATFEKRVSTPTTGAPVTTTRLTYLTTDHLAAPILATDAAGAAVWQGGFTPFGEDWNGAEAAGVFLRLAGQWEDESWTKTSLGTSLSYNVNRWYEPSSGRYTQKDPMGVQGGTTSSLNLLYGYAAQNPMVFLDPLGLLNLHPTCQQYKKQIEDAVKKAKQALDKPRKDCSCTGDKKTKMKNHLDNATYYCPENDEFILGFFHLPLGVCGGTRNARGVEDDQSITLIVPQVFDTEKCGCLEGTIFHEASHNVLDTSDHSETNNAYDVANGCIPCARKR